jgi:predicted TIM-barrel fold metal-dependent hydrolase
LAVAPPDFGIVDIHSHIFPPLAGACGFADAATHLLHQQRAMHVHGNQPYRRRRDHALSELRPLWSATDPSEAGRKTDVEFRVGTQGRFQWRVNGEDYYVQFLPPHMVDLSSPVETVITEMDYAGIETAVLQNDHIYGNLAEDFAAAAKRYPGRFIGLAQVEESFAFQDSELQRLADQLDRLGMAGLYFTMTGLFRNGYQRLPDHPDYAPLWSMVEKRGIPVFWVHSARSPVGTYTDEMVHLSRIIERYPTIRHHLVHGIPTALYADDSGRVQLPDIIVELLSNAPVHAEILYPIGWGGRHEYPYSLAVEHARQLVGRFGTGKFLWGSDMPNVARYCTYRQSLTYLWNHADFLSPADRRAVFRENALALLRPAASAKAG